jgi:hypothetical protein
MGSCDKGQNHGQSEGQNVLPSPLENQWRVLMLKNDMVFPQRFEAEGRLSACIQGVTGVGLGEMFYGYTYSPSTANGSKFGAIWDRWGNCLFCVASTRLDTRKLVFPETESQKLYKKLTVDQRAILAALSDKTKLAKNYLMEVLKVDINLANQINEEAYVKEYK